VKYSYLLAELFNRSTELALYIPAGSHLQQA
jgi:hypothetical protein